MVILGWVLAIGLALTVLPWSAQLLAEAYQRTAAIRLPPDAWALLFGAATGVLLAAWRRPNRFLQTLQHELAHAFLCLLLWVKIHKFYVSDRDGGFVLPERTDPLRKYLILIAPYVLPLWLAPVLIARHFVSGPGAWRWSLQLAAGLFLIQHLQGLGHNIRNNCRGANADLVRMTRPLAAVSILIGLALLLSWWLTAVWRF